MPPSFKYVDSVFSETSINFWQTTVQHVPEKSTLRSPQINVFFTVTFHYTKH